MKNSQQFEISGQIVDVVGSRIFPGTIVVANGKIREIREEKVEEEVFILPGLIDAHIHIESSMLVPSEFARLAVAHGTVATVSDPHEIANVLGIPGVEFMIANGKQVPFRFYFGAPSCVPATSFETAGAVLGASEVEALLAMPEIRYLSEMMNFPGVLYNDPEVISKLEAARRLGKPVDGHAPGLSGEAVAKYIGAGISTDHECFTIEEAHEKINLGMHILIREGSAAKNFDTLYPLIDEYPEQVMLCSDDLHPDDLAENHIDQHVRRAISMGLNILNVLRSCTLNPVRHYGLDSGLLQTGDNADFIVVDDLAAFHVLATYIGGMKVAEKGRSLMEHVGVEPVNNFVIEKVNPQSLTVHVQPGKLKVLRALEGQLITDKLLVDPTVVDGNVVADAERDILKIVVVNRYRQSPPAIGFISNFGLKRGAVASSVSHDSHNIVAVGTDDESLAEAINLIIEAKGGISMVSGEEKHLLPLPVAGIMSNDDGYLVARRYREMDNAVKHLGTTLPAPFMTLSFMALLVIPSLKLSDLGLFDGNSFSFTSLFEN